MANKIATVSLAEATDDNSLPDISSLQFLPTATIHSVLNTLFEPSLALITLIEPALRAIPSDRALRSYTELAAFVREQLLGLRIAAAATGPDAAAAKDRLLSILGAHPRLGAKKVNSSQSAAEQTQLQTTATGEAAKLAELNTAYETTFPGLIYVVFVNGRSREVIMANMSERIARADYAAEELEAIEAMVAIANDRASKLPQWKVIGELQKETQ